MGQNTFADVTSVIDDALLHNSSGNVVVTRYTSDEINNFLGSGRLTDQRCGIRLVTRDKRYQEKQIDK